MRLWWNHLFVSRAYRGASPQERRLIDIRFCLARELKRQRRIHRVTQRMMAERIGVSRAAVSRVERASKRVSLDVGVRCLIELGCTDEEVGSVFNAGSNPGIDVLRRRMEIQRYFNRPHTPCDDYRFVVKKKKPRSEERGFLEI